MFNFLKKNDVEILYAPFNGKSISLQQVPDPVFSSKMMGEGIAFELTDGILYSPCDGTIMLVANTLHAYGFKTNLGTEILIHIGLDSVNLCGKGFEFFLKEGDKVKKGDKVAKVDLDYLKKNNINSITPMVITSHNKEISEKLEPNVSVTATQTKIMKIK